MLSQGILSSLWLLGRAHNKPWERGILRKKRLHWYACGSVYFLARKKEETHKSHNLLVSLARDTPESSTSYCGLNLVTLERIVLEGTIVSIPAPPRSSISSLYLNISLLPRLKKKKKKDFPLVLPLYWFPQDHVQEKKQTFSHSVWGHSLFFLLQFK